MARVSFKKNLDTAKELNSFYLEEAFRILNETTHLSGNETEVLRLKMIGCKVGVNKVLATLRRDVCQLCEEKKKLQHYCVNHSR